MNKLRIPTSAILGIVLIAVGVISLMSSLGYFASYDIFSMFWPAIIILFGVRGILDHRSSTLFGLILTGIGGMILVDNLGYAFLGKLEMDEMIIPLIVIIIGLNFILPKSKKRSTCEYDETVTVETYTQGANSYTTTKSEAVKGQKRATTTTTTTVEVNPEQEANKSATMPPMPPKPTQAQGAVKVDPKDVTVE